MSIALTPLGHYIWFLKERMNIWHKKEVLKESPPWTEDEILSYGFFTNIYRELDRNSRYEIEFLRKEKDPVQQLYKICLFRHSNSILLFELLLKDPTLEEVLELRSKVSGKEFFSDAMMSPPGLNSEGERLTRPEWVLYYKDSLKREVSSLYQKIINSDSGWDVIEILKSPERRIGPFFAYEMYTSLTYCDWFPWTEDDAYVIGPGAKPYLLSRLKMKSLEEVRDQVFPVLEKDSEFIWIPESFQPKNPVPHKFTLRTVEHSLCECRKYTGIWKDGKDFKRVYRRPA